MPAPIVPIAVGLAARLAAKKAAEKAAKKAAEKAAKAAAKKAAQKATSGPKFTDYGLRRATNDLTKAEKQAEHKWRMKNDLDYKNQIAIKKAAAKKASLKQPKPKGK